MADLPHGHTWRRATPADAEAIHALVSRCNIEVVGYADCTLDDIRFELVEPGYTLETDSWLVHDADGGLAGYGWTIGQGTGELAHVEVITQDEAVASWLFDRVMARATELARAGGHDRVTADKGIYRADTRMRAVAAAHGFTPATVFHRMRVDHGAVVPEPVAPAGVTVHTGPGDEDFRRTAHALLTESFKDHFGWVARPFDEWQQALEQEPTFDWSQLTVAELDGRPVGVMVANDRMVEDEDCGYVADLGVLPEARGRGIAKHLLLSAFAADARAGRTGTMLNVDTNNTTPALGLYESVGMRPVLVIDLWRRVD
jgi:mycothiol synthase